MSKDTEMSKTAPKWRKHDRIIKKGDVLRAKAARGGYVYGVASGGGFGSRPDAIGHAVYLHHETYDLDEAIAHRHDEGKAADVNSARWNRSDPPGNIEILED